MALGRTSMNKDHVHPHRSFGGWVLFQPLKAEKTMTDAHPHQYTHLGIVFWIGMHAFNTMGMHLSTIIVYIMYPSKYTLFDWYNKRLKSIPNPWMYLTLACTMIDALMIVNVVGIIFMLHYCDECVDHIFLKPITCSKIVCILKSGGAREMMLATHASMWERCFIFRVNKVSWYVNFRQDLFNELN